MQLTDMLSPHFSAQEIFGRCGIPDDPVLRENGRRLCQTLLEPAREDWAAYLLSSGLRGSPVWRVIVGYRSPAHNAEVGGVQASQHMLACAADVACDVEWDRLRDGIGSARDAQRMRLFATFCEQWAKTHDACGGIGFYSEQHTGQCYWVHLDIRPRIDGHLAMWSGHHVGSEVA